jgi:sulfate adenylyltransferase
MSKLVPPHGSPELKPLLLEGAALDEEMKKAEGLKKVPMTTRETSDLIMLGIGAFTPLDGFMGKDDWKGVCESYQMPSMDNLFWPRSRISPTRSRSVKRSRSGTPKPRPSWVP